MNQDNNTLPHPSLRGSFTAADEQRYARGLEEWVARVAGKTPKAEADAARKPPPRPDKQS